MIGERFELDGRLVEVVEETPIVSYHAAGRELRYTAQAVREVRGEDEAEGDE